MTMTRGTDPNVRDVERFWSKVGPRREDACWLWIGGRFASGYGSFHVGGQNGKRYQAHRWIYEQVVGPIPPGLQLDHTCHNVDWKCRGGPSCLHRRCINPAHLEPVTPVVNVNRTPNSSGRRTHCPAGHPYDEENTRIYQGRRYCRQCRRDRKAEYEQRWQAKGGVRTRDTPEGREARLAYQRQWDREKRRKQRMAG